MTCTCCSDANLNWQDQIQLASEPRRQRTSAMDGSEIGVFGTLRLMKRTTNEQVAVFPIDEETVTFGRDPTCSVRLYYPDVSALHAKLVFQERKARVH